MNADEYIELLGNILKQLTEVDNKEMIAVAILQELAKDRRMEEIKANGNGSKPATPKQVAYLKRLGIKTETGITKQEASRLIDEAVAGK